MSAAACGSAASAVLTWRAACRIAGSVANVWPGRGPGSARPPRPGPHAQPVQGLLGLPGLAGVVAGQALAAQGLPGHEDDGDQGEPAEHGGLAVPGAPPGDPLDQRGRDHGGTWAAAETARCLFSADPD